MTTFGESEVLLCVYGASTNWLYLQAWSEEGAFCGGSSSTVI